MVEEIFKDLSGLPRWVPYRLVWNPKREKSDKTPYGLDASGCLRKLSTKNPNHWVTMAAAISIWQANKDNPGGKLDGIGIVLTGGIEIDGWRLIGFDYDQVDFEKFELPFPGYSEKSPSGTGIRAFAWVPVDWAIRFKDTVIHPKHCDHCEIYIGTSARFLTLTFDVIDDSLIPRLSAVGGGNE